jgi:hypothetical protein
MAVKADLRAFLVEQTVIVRRMRVVATQTLPLPYRKMHSGLVEFFFQLGVAAITKVFDL